jgi:hypothetical protein
MDSLLADGEPVAKQRDAAIFVDDALLRLKLWREELQRKSPQALNLIQTQDLKLHQIITSQLGSLHDTLNMLEELCHAEMKDERMSKLKYVH